MREGSLEAPVRRPIDWTDPDFYDEAALEKEMRRVFDICHGCRRCFNLCDSFPRLFDLVDAAGDAEVHGIDSRDFGKVVDACTLCDLCFMTKCPYVPPHEWDLDFPHLMLRHRAIEARKGGRPFREGQLGRTDRNGKLAGLMAPAANWATDRGNRPMRSLMEKVAGVHRDADLPKFHSKTFVRRAKEAPAAVSASAPARGRKAVLYATCFVNYNNPAIGEATLGVLARNGVECEVAYPECCGMPQLEQGDLPRVAKKAKNVAAALLPYVEQGYDVVALVPSCALMLKFEWPLLLPDDPDVKKLSQAIFDISEYVVDIAKREGLAPGLTPIEGGVAVHLACHARAQNMGPKSAEMLRLIPGTQVAVVERCSGHGGSWGVMLDNFEVALKVGKPAAEQLAKLGRRHVASECPLAGQHILQGMERLEGIEPPAEALHPIQLLARAYGIANA
ncbi:MAG: glycerol-3-phosphate dehydrogenase [Alphaproteobacteria bacterium]|nr:glycerol-3-phosphate dehydrogenase [Alphaproteobacteria bacterium]